MARVPYLTVNDLSEENKDLLKRGITLHRALVNSPNAARAFGGLGQFIRFKSRLDPRLREMAILQVGWATRAPYEWSHHIKIGMGFGVTKDDIRAIIADTDGKPTTLGALDRLVLRAAREAVAGPGIAEATVNELKQHLDNELLVDLTVTIAFYCAVVRLLSSLAIDVEPEYQPYLDEFPLPA